MTNFRPLIVMSAFLAVVAFVATKGLDASGGSTPAPDATAPRDPATVTSSSHGIDEASEDTTVDVSWTAGSDPAGDGEVASGVAGYSVQWSMEPDTVPDPAVDVTGTSDTSPELADGRWWFHLSTIDRAGNRTMTYHFGPVSIRRAPPTTTTSTTVAAAPGRRATSPTTTRPATRPTTNPTTATSRPPTTSPPPSEPPPQPTTTGHYHPPGHEHG